MDPASGAFRPSVFTRIQTGHFLGDAAFLHDHPRRSERIPLLDPCYVYPPIAKMPHCLRFGRPSPALLGSALKNMHFAHHLVSEQFLELPMNCA